MLTLAFFVAAITLPGAPPVAMDYLAYDAENDRLWVPAGNTGNLDVVDLPGGKVTPISGFPTAPRPSGGHGPGMMGPSSVTIADKVAWVGNRGDNKVCAFDRKTLARGECVQLNAMPDGVEWVATTGELWITTPRDQTLTIVAHRPGDGADGKGRAQSGGGQAGHRVCARFSRGKAADRRAAQYPVATFALQSPIILHGILGGP